jgi:ABC-type sugar transport system permease subunit
VSRARWTPYLLIAPTVLLMAVFLAYPVGSVVYYSLQHYNATRSWANGFAGLDNFRQMLLHDPLFWQSLGFSVRWVVVEVGLQLVLGLVLALIVNETFVGRGLARALVFSPWAVSGVLTTGIWILLYNPSTGLFEQLAFNNVDLLYTLTGGGPADQTTTLPLYVARKAVDSHDFGYGSALTTAGFVVLLFFSVLYLRLSKFDRR